MKEMGFPDPGAKPVAEAVIVTGPTAFPVTVNVATPATAFVEPRPVIVAVPAVFANVTLSMLFGPEVTVFPLASWIVAVSNRVLLDARSAVDPLSASFVAALAFTTIPLCVPVIAP